MFLLGIMFDYAITALLGFFGLLLFHVYVQYNKFGRHVNKTPGPPILPILGNLLDLNVSPVGVNEVLRKWGNEYYPIYRLWLGNKAVICIRHPDDLEAILTSNQHIYKEFVYELLVPWLNFGLLTSFGQKWHQRRKILTPAFHFNILKKYLDIINEEGDKFIKEIKARGKEVTLDLLPYVSNHTLNVICESAMGVALDDDEYKESAKKYKEAVYKMGNMIVYRSVRPYIKEWMLPLLPHLAKEKKEILGQLDYFTDKIIKERREYHKSTNHKLFEALDEQKEVDLENLYMGKKKRLAMLDLLLKAEKEGQIDDLGIKEEVATFIFEGHDTTAMGLFFAILLLAENKEAQSKARDEVKDVMNRTNGRLEISDLQELNYLERCIKESLRIFPSVPTIIRTLQDDLQLKNAYLPKGTHVIINFIDVHKDPQFWPDPEKFDPDRFLPDQVKKRHPFSYVPFSAGPRNCIGQKFAFIELKALLAKILHNFYLEPVDRTSDIKLMTDLVIRPETSAHVKFVRIDKK